MTMHAEPFEPSTIARYARNNALGFSILTIAYLLERGLSVEDWAVELGKRFAGPGTNWETGMGAAAMAREAAIELVSMNGRLIDLSGDDASAVAIVEWPRQEDLDRERVSRDASDAFWHVWLPIAASVGLRVEWSTDASGLTTLCFWR
jgi:hypothetical protein